MRSMRSSRRLAGLLASGLLLFAPAALAEQAAEETQVQGTAGIGGHVSDVQEELGRVREFDLGRESIQPDLIFDLFGRTGTNRWNLFLKYHDEHTARVESRLEAGPRVNARFDHRSFVHWLDHDRMESLSWREFMRVDDQGKDVAGGKMVTHEDADPDGRYGIRYAETHGLVEVAIPGLAFQHEAGWYLDLGPDAPSTVGEEWFSVQGLISAGR